MVISFVSILSLLLCLPYHPLTIRAKCFPNSRVFYEFPENLTYSRSAKKNINWWFRRNNTLITLRQSEIGVVIRHNCHISSNLILLVGKSLIQIGSWCMHCWYSFKAIIIATNQQQEELLDWVCVHGCFAPPGAALLSWYY